MPITIDLRENVIYKDGLQQGLQQGLEKGIEQGLEQGLALGLEKGRQNILRMWRTGRFSMSELAEILEMEVVELQHQLHLAAEDEKRMNDNLSDPDL